MKLSPAQVHRVQQQIDGRVIPNRHTLSPQLQRAFGNHTFFLDSEGLNIVEPSPADSQVGNVVKLASWADDAHTTLEPNPPEPKPVVVQLGSMNKQSGGSASPGPTRGSKRNKVAQ